METITVKDCGALLGEINEFADWPDYIYRGHSQSDWALESTLSRALKRLKYENKEELVRRHLQRFQLKIRGRRGSHPRALSDNELWALGQHFGLFTPLLDWTQSPYVALFFALIRLEPSSTGMRTLWALNTYDVDGINEFHQKNQVDSSMWSLELVNPILDENSRLLNQDGLFTKISIKNTVDNWVSAASDLGWVTLYKIDFPENIRNEALSYLNLMNINYSSLFPDLVGSSLWTNIELEQTDYIEAQQEKFWSNQ